MLDAYIIDKLRREREEQQRDGSFIPLHIDAPRMPERREETERSPNPPTERGSIVIDFHF